MLIDPYRFGESDPDWASVRFLAGYDSAYTDESSYAHAVDSSTSMSVGSGTVKYGAGALVCGAAGGSILNYDVGTDLDLGTSDFCIECWAYCPSSGGTTGTVLHMATTPSGIGSSFQFIASPSTLQFIGYNAAGGTLISMSSGAVLTTDAWIHLAMTRQGSTFRMFTGGVLRANTTSATAFGAYAPGLLRVGNNAGGSDPYVGFVDEVRVTIGAARYTAGFTPPAAAFPRG